MLEAGHEVQPLPGASAPLAALVGSGLPAERFSFVGFPPRRAGERRALFEALSGRRETLIFFESPRRLGETLRDLADCLGPRRACVARELTKLHEEWARDTLPALAERFAEGARGELTLVVEGASGEAEVADDPTLEIAIRARAAAGGSPSEIARDVARATGLPRKTVYPHVERLRSKEADS